MRHYKLNPDLPKVAHPTTARAAKGRNELLTCNARGCNEQRHGLSNHCKAHALTYQRYGHPRGGLVKPQRFQGLRKPVLDLVHANATHPGVVSALSFLTSWMAAEGHKGATELARIARHGVSALDVLVEVAAFWCFVDQNPRALPDTKAENVGIARAVCALAPRPRRFTLEANQKGTNGYAPKAKPAALAYIGSHLRAVLSHLLLNFAASVANKDEQAKQALIDLRAPLKPAIAVLLAEAAARPKEVDTNY